MSLAELRAALVERNLGTGGVKAALCARLAEALEAKAAAAASTGAGTGAGPSTSPAATAPVFAHAAKAGGEVAEGSGSQAEPPAAETVERPAATGRAAGGQRGARGKKAASGGEVGAYGGDDEEEAAGSEDEMDRLEQMLALGKRGGCRWSPALRLERRWCTGSDSTPYRRAGASLQSVESRMDRLALVRGLGQYWSCIYSAHAA